MKRRTTVSPAKSGRSCGACTLCCTYLEIESEQGYSTRLDNAEDLAKQAGEPCRYLTAQGCGIYEVRPLVCRQFYCDWVLGQNNFKEQDTPHNIGVIGVRGVNWHFRAKPSA